MMASEIELYSEVREALRHGFTKFGAGGFLGERRLLCASEFSIAAKITRVIDMGGGEEMAGRRDRVAAPIGAAPGIPPEGRLPRVGYAGKLGDFSSFHSASWAEYEAATDGVSAKFICHADMDAELMFGRLLGYAQAGDALFDRCQNGELRREHLVTRGEAERLAIEIRRLGRGMGDVECAERLEGYAAKVEAAALLLS